MDETSSIVIEYRKKMEAYAKLTTDELLALEGQRDSDTLAVVFGRLLDRKFVRAVGQETYEPLGWEAFTAQVWDLDAGRVSRGPLTEEELIAVAIVELEAHVRNGGFDSFFHHRGEFTPIVGKALRRIGRPDLAEIAERAVECLGVSKQKFKGNEYFDQISEAVCPDDDEAQAAINAKLDKCDEQFFEIDDDILESLFEFIKANRDKIIGGPDIWGPVKPDPSAPTSS